MTKTEFKALYSFYRNARFNFQSYIQNANLPCGADDAAYERFEYSEQEWLDQNPVIKRVLDIMDCDDVLKQRQQELAAWGRLHPRTLQYTHDVIMGVA